MSERTGRILRTAVTTGLPFGIGMGAFLGWRNGAAGGAMAGVVMAVTFGLVMAFFAEAQRRKLQVAAIDGEPVLHQGPANHRKIEWRGGWLALTPTRLVFRAHKVNLQTAPLAIALADVRAVEAASTLGIVPNGLRVQLEGGEKEAFVVSDRAGWLARIGHALEKRG